MRRIPIFVLALLLLAPMSISATEIDETEEALEALSNDLTGEWTAISPQGGRLYYIIAIDPSNTNIIYVGCDVGVFKSTNGGLNWTLITGLIDIGALALAIDPQTPTTIYAGTYSEADLSGVYKSTNGGANWTPTFTGLWNSSVSSLAIDPHTPTTIYAGYAGATSGGVLKSTDGGGFWARMITDRWVFMLAIDPHTPTTIYAGSEILLYKSIDGGISWGAVMANASALAFDPHTPGTIYAGTWDGVSTVGGVFKSTNGGSTWTPMNTGLTNTNVFALAIDPHTPATVYAGTNGGGVFKSTNGGSTWTPMNTGLTNTNVFALAIDPMTPSILYAGTNNGLFKFEQEACPAPGMVSNPSPSNQAANVSTTITFNWSGHSNADSYDVYLGTTSDPTTLVGSSITTSFPLTGLNLNTTYYWKIVAKNSCGNSTSGPVWSFSTIQSNYYTLTVTKSGTGGGTATSNPSGINCGSTCKANFTSGTSVTLTASADAGSTFSGWSGGGCSGTDPCTITLNSNTTIEASFALSGDCAYTISPTNKTFNTNGGNVSINVSATGQTNCPVPPVVEDAEWISISGTPTWKANKGTVKIAVQKNPGSQSRTGVVTIGGETLTIKEGGAKCQLMALKPSSGKYPSTGGSGSFDITVSPQDCGWNVATTFDWIHLDTTAGTGNGTAPFNIDPNGTGKSRTGKIDVSLAQNATKKKTFTVNESK